MRKQKPCPLKLGKEVYGNKKIEDAFKAALEPYFRKGNGDE